MISDQQLRASRSLIVHICLALLIIAVTFAVVSFFPVRHSETPPFASPAFQRTWVSEADASTGVIDLWGNEPLSWRVEPYIGAPNNRRVVQYFERGRMEVESGSSEISYGSLVAEMVSGQIDLGHDMQIERQAPDIPIDSGDADDRIPTYLTLSRFLHQPADDQTGERIRDWISSAGRFERDSTPQVLQYGRYIDQTGHNLPDVTVELFRRPEFQGNAWIESFGYPITEPFWADYRRMDDVLPSLVQVFERRILVYTPGFEPARAFTVANSGRHYSWWRYGSEPHPEEPAPPANATDSGLVLGDDLEAWVYAEDLGTPVDLTLAPTGHLMILTLEGEILKADSLDPDGHPDGFTIWADGIADPQGMVTAGDSVLVTASNRILWFHEEDGAGVLGHTEEIAPGTLMNSLSEQGTEPVTGKPIVNSTGDVYTRTGSTDTGEVLREVGTSDPVVDLEDVLEQPGPAIFSSTDLLLAGTNEDGHPSVVVVPSTGREVQPGIPTPVATFPDDVDVRALAVANEEIWNIAELGEVIVAVMESDGASIFALSRGRGIDQTEMVELAAGLGRPAAVEIGLDGSLYIADAEQQRVVRIQYVA